MIESDAYAILAEKHGYPNSSAYRRILEFLMTPKQALIAVDLPLSLEEIATKTKQGSLCGLGKTAPNPVLTTLMHFREEYEAHINGICPAKKCKALIKYAIDDSCIGCTICAQKCPAEAIPIIPYKKHEIIQDICTKCDTCRIVCPTESVKIITN